MECIYCDHTTQVTNSRPQRRLHQIWRRRRCTSCGAIFTTIEKIELPLSVLVDTQGNVVPFYRDKLFLSVHEACGHRKTALSDATALTDTIIARLRPLMVSGKIENHQIAEAAHQALRRFDKAAAVHYRAYHL